MKRLLLLAMLCACTGADDEPPLSARFTARPAVVQASSDLSDACMEALTDDVLWYRERGVTLAISIVEPDAPSQLGIPVGGVIAVHNGTPSKPDAGAETWPSLTIGGNIFYADVTLRTCDARAIAHELGHALGLVDTFIQGNLMNQYLELGGWSLTESQLEWIED